MDSWDFKKERIRVKKSSVDGIVDLDPVSPSAIHGDVEKVQDHHGIGIDTPADDVEQGEKGKQLMTEPPPVSQLRRSTKERHPSKMYPTHEYVMITDAGELESDWKVQDNEHNGKWLKAMHDELDSLQKNHTYDMVKLPEGDCTRLLHIYLHSYIYLVINPANFLSWCLILQVCLNEGREDKTK